MYLSDEIHGSVKPLLWTLCSMSGTQRNATSSRAPLPIKGSQKAKTTVRTYAGNQSATPSAQHSRPNVLLTSPPSIIISSPRLEGGTEGGNRSAKLLLSRTNLHPLCNCGVAVGGILGYTNGGTCAGATAVW